MASSSQRPARSTRRAQFVLADSIADDSDNDSNFSDVNLMDFDISDESSDDDASVVGPRDGGGDAISNDGVWTVIRNPSNDKCLNVNDSTSPIGPDTFKLILRFFHVSDSDQEPEKGTPEYDQLYKFRAVLEHLNKAWQKEFTLGHIPSIDESIVGFKGRHPLVNYIRIKKHHQWGPKEYNLCDSATGYCSQTMYHTKGMTKGVSGQPFSVCEALMEPHMNNNHHPIVDNYYTSVDFCEKFLTKGTYITRTVRAGRVKLPNKMKVKMNNKREILASRKGNLLAVSWVDRKQARLLSTCSTANMVEKKVYNATREVPQVVLDYNSGMGA
ncbi:piggyBac transposable element-derived protein 4-like [Watersipora subatra]|uniref:piggyBac transposable element-derived protein 4-like n=1 Tax=Watersipora subatra TaxID=2589382 RepID=UPI00355C1957